MSNPRTGGSACCTKDKIFIIGGLLDAEKLVQSVEAYNIPKNICETINIKNSSCFLPCIDSCSLFINENHIMILGGARKHPLDIYFTNNRSFISLEDSIAIENGAFIEDFPHNFLGGYSVIYQKEIYILAKLRRESKNYGPFEQAIIVLDLEKNHWKYEPMIDL